MLSRVRHAPTGEIAMPRRPLIGRSEPRPTTASSLGRRRSLAKLASVNSSYLAGLARVALVACQDCETECRKHADKHFACKACAEACVVCAAECKRTAA